ncbi:hypothetical protein MKW92_034131, partial [Papaver armeniacum]
SREKKRIGERIEKSEKIKKKLKLLEGFNYYSFLFDFPQISLGTQQYDEKNIWRRVYDALNVLMAMDIISKDKKYIHWKGLPRTTVHDSNVFGLRSSIEKKDAYLQELEEQFVGLQNLIQRNRFMCFGNVITGGVSLPFILVRTLFELHDDNYVINLMNLCGRPESDDANCVVVETGGGEVCMMVDTQCHSTYLDTQCHGY